MGKSSRKKRKASEEVVVREGSLEPSQSGSETGLLHFKYYLAASVSLITFLVYLPSLQNGIVYWDDNNYVFDNPNIRSFDTSFFRWAFLDFYEANWHPLTWISHAFDYAVWGLNPLGHHLTNNILHAVNTSVVVLLVARLAEAWKENATEDGPSAFLNDRVILISGGITGLLFGLHPLHVESVAWVAERKDLLCALFFLLSIIMYTKYAAKTSLSFFLVGNLSPRKNRAQAVMAKTGPRFFNKRYLLVLGFFTLALLSKPMAVTLPFVLLILDWYPLERIRSMKQFWSAVTEKLPFIALSLVSSILTMLAQKAGEAIESIENVPLSTRLPVAAKSLIVYLWKMILPVNLVPYYPYPERVSFFSLEYISAIVLAVGITIACVLMAKKQKVLMSVWGYYVVTLIPVLGIVQVGAQSMADRYTYLPSLGPFLIIGLLGAWGFGRLGDVQQHAHNMKLFGITMTIFILLLLSFLTVEQIKIWKDPSTLWDYVIEKEPEKVPLAYNNQGIVFGKKGQLDKAIENFDKAIALKRYYSDPYYNRGLAYIKKGNKELAMLSFQEACGLGHETACNAVKDLQTVRTDQR